MPVLLAQVPAASVDSSMATPATQTCRDAAGSTQIRPNHQPNVDCDEASADVLAVLVHVVPASAEVQKPRKFPVASVVRYRPRTPPGTKRLPAAAAKILFGLVGSMASRPMRSLPASPAGCQVVPPSIERNTPLPGNVTLPPPGLPSPVPANRVPPGVIARAPIDGVTVAGHARANVRPASVLRHTPPVAAPAYTVSGRAGSTTRSVTRPPTLAGPSGCHA